MTERTQGHPGQTLGGAGPGPRPLSSGPSASRCQMHSQPTLDRSWEQNKSPLEPCTLGTSGPVCICGL